MMAPPAEACDTLARKRGADLSRRHQRAHAPGELRDTGGSRGPLDASVLHYDADFDFIADVTGQRCQWAGPAATDRLEARSGSPREIAAAAREHSGVDVLLEQQSARPSC